MNLQAAKTNFERELSNKEEAAEEARRNLIKQLRELEGQLEDERKGRIASQSASKKLENDLSEVEALVETETKGKEDALRLYKKAQVCVSAFSATSWHFLGYSCFFFCLDSTEGFADGYPRCCSG